MSIFQTHFALIEDAWNMRISPSITNSYKVQPLENPPDEAANVRRYLNETYKKNGIQGVRQIIDDVIVRDLVYFQKPKPKPRTSLLPSISTVTQEQWMYVLLGLFTLLFVFDA